MSQWTEKRPSEDYYQVLAPDGSLVGDPPDLEDETLLDFFRTIVKTRTLEEKTLNMQRHGEISIIARSLGEEAISLASAAALSPGDWCFPSYRQSPALLYWGVPMERLIANLMGCPSETIDEHLPVPEEEAPDITFTPAYVPLAVNVTNAVGSAMYDGFNESDTVSMSYIGDGSTSQGDFHEALNFAGVFEAPSVTICQNNQWAISVPSHRQTKAETFAQKATAHGVPHERVDGNDVLAVFEKTKEAVKRAREGDGSTFIECVTYRMVEHNTADEESVYRDEEEREYWEERDPLDRLEALLRKQGLLDDESVEAIEVEMKEAVQEAVNAARKIPTANPEKMFDHHLHSTSWKEQHQRAELRAERNGENPFTDFTGEGL